jgi:hypothetical protein
MRFAQIILRRQLGSLKSLIYVAIQVQLWHLNAMRRNFGAADVIKLTLNLTMDLTTILTTILVCPPKYGEVRKPYVRNSDVGGPLACLEANGSRLHVSGV